MAIKIKDIRVLQRYGFKLDINKNLKKYWVYDCLDNGAYVLVYEDDLIVRFGTPFGDEIDDVIFKLIKDGHCELGEDDK